MYAIERSRGQVLLFMDYEMARVFAVLSSTPSESMEQPCTLLYMCCVGVCAQIVAVLLRCVYGVSHVLHYCSVLSVHVRAQDVRRAPHEHEL